LNIDKVISTQTNKTIKAKLGKIETEIIKLLKGTEKIQAEENKDKKFCIIL
jgi:hypothetical protein